MSVSLTLFKIFGIPLRINITWLVIFGLVLTSLAMFQFPSLYPQWSALEHWYMAIATTLLFFSSVVVHELSHSIVALRHGLPVKSITLFIFGGMAHIGREADRPRSDALIALAGPLSSLLLAGTFSLLAYLGHGLSQQLGALATWLAIINLGLALFNLVPGFPLDGGRVLRAVLWGATGNYIRASKVATIIGRVVAYSLIATGGILVFLGYFASGIWAIFIGLVLDTAALASYKQALWREDFRQQRASDLMSSAAISLSRKDI